MHLSGGTRAGRAGAPQGQAWLPFRLSAGHALDMPCLAPQQSWRPSWSPRPETGCPAPLPGAGGWWAAQKIQLGLAQQPHTLVLSAWPSPPAGGGALPRRAWHLVVGFLGVWPPPVWDQESGSDLPTVQEGHKTPSPRWEWAPVVGPGDRRVLMAGSGPATEEGPALHLLPPSGTSLSFLISQEGTPLLLASNSCWEHQRR